MQRGWIYPLIFVLSLANAGLAQVFVSPAGDDANPGTAGKPVASVGRAVQLARELSGPARRVVLMPGQYFDTGIELTSADSDLVLESKGGPATLVGGVLLGNWQPDGPQFWSATLPAGRPWDVRMLQVNGRFCPRARFPEQGTLTHSSVFKVPWMSTTGGGWKRKPTQEELTTLEYKHGDLPPGLDIRNAEITVFHMWDESVAGIAENDVAGRKLRLAPPLGHPPGAFGVQKYCLWNIREGMTRPGEWYFDRSKNRIVYWPLNGEDMRSAVVVVPTQRMIIRIVGATNVTLRNFNLAVTTVPLITGGFAAAAFDGAIQLENAAGANLSRLGLRNLAGQAIRGMHQQKFTRVIDCNVSGCGAGGIYLSGSNNLVSNNLVHGVGLSFPSAIGIYGGGPGCKVSHNEIYDTTYSAIGLDGRDMIIENNRLSDCMKILHDGAAIYCSGAKRSVIRNNFAHDIVDTGGYGSSAYYLDEQCEDCVVEQNISLNVARPSHNHMATNNVIRNNVFISRGDMRLTFPRCSGYWLEHNVIYSGGALTFEGVNNVSSWIRNLVYSATGKIEGTDLKDYATVGTFPGLPGRTIIGDPRFRRLDKSDLRYRSYSPARRLGLMTLSPAMAGRVK